MKGAWPVEAQANGGRHYRGNAIDQNFDNYTVEYTYPDGTKLFLYGRSIAGCYEKMASYGHGSKGSATISFRSHTPGKCRIFKGQDVSNNDDVVWAFPQPEPNPYQNEWDDLIDAIRQDKPYNEVKRGAEASLVTCMGRMAAHTGQVVTFDQMLNHDHEFAPDVDKLAMDSPAPLLAGPDGKYPVPQPGIVTKREY
jgi:predicted dehydrogenase